MVVVAVAWFRYRWFDGLDPTVGCLEGPDLIQDSACARQSVHEESLRSGDTALDWLTRSPKLKTVFAPSRDP